MTGLWRGLATSALCSFAADLDAVRVGNGARRMVAWLIGVLVIADQLPEVAHIDCFWLDAHDPTLLNGRIFCALLGAELGMENLPPPGRDPEPVAVPCLAELPPVPFCETVTFFMLDAPVFHVEQICCDISAAKSSAAVLCRQTSKPLI